MSLLQISQNLLSKTKHVKNIDFKIIHHKKEHETLVWIRPGYELSELSLYLHISPIISCFSIELIAYSTPSSFWNDQQQEILNITLISSKKNIRL